MFCDFHTHRPGKNALVSAEKMPEHIPYWSFQIHPWDLPEKFVFPEPGFFDSLSSAAALGEIGLDRLKGPSLEVQRKYLDFFLETAEARQLAVVIHCVRCDAELDAALKNFSGKVLIHGFRGGEKRLLNHLEKGRFVSFAPGGWKHCPETLRENGLRNIGLETDDALLDIKKVYEQAEAETKIAGWESICADNFLRFTGGK